MISLIVLALFTVFNREITAHLVERLPLHNSEADKALTCKNGGTFFKGKCHCPKRWTGTYCTCLQDVVSCIEPRFNIECMGNGRCECGACRCEKWHSGRYCEIVSPFIKYDPKELDRLVDEAMHGPFVEIIMKIAMLDQSEKTFIKMSKIISEIGQYDSNAPYEKIKSKLNALYFQLLLKRRKHQRQLESFELGSGEENEVGPIKDGEFDSLSNELSNESGNLQKIIEIDISEDAEPQAWTTQLDLDENVHGLTTDRSSARSSFTVNPFSFLEIENRTFGIHTHHLTLLMFLDREDEDFYKMNILDSKGSLYAMIAVTVLDTNDHAPVFQQSVYSFDATNKQSTTFRIYAVDEDDGENGTVTYRLVNEDDRFSLDNETGQFRLNSPSTVMNNTRIQVEAVDNGSPPRSDRSTIIINSDVTKAQGPEKVIEGQPDEPEFAENNGSIPTVDNVTSFANETVELETENINTTLPLAGVYEILTTDVTEQVENITYMPTQAYTQVSVGSKIPIIGDNNNSNITDHAIDRASSIILTEVTTSKTATLSSTSVHATAKTGPTPFIADFHHPIARDVYLFQDSGYVLECNASGWPQPEISWKYWKFSSWLRYAKRIENGSNDGIFVQKSFSLDIVNACYENSGWYACMASNSEGTVRQKRRIFVVDSSNYTRNLTEKLKIKLGKPTQIKCKAATGLRYPHVVSWNKHPGRIDFSNVKRKKNVLTIKKSRKVDKGNYTCTVLSKLEGPKRYTMILY